MVIGERMSRRPSGTFSGTQSPAPASASTVSQVAEGGSRSAGYCVIEVGHPKRTPASWVNAGDPTHRVCDHHKQQYETAYYDYNITWMLPE